MSVQGKPLTEAEVVSELDGFGRGVESTLALIGVTGTETFFVAADAVALWRRPTESDAAWEARVREQAELVRKGTIR